MSQHADIDMMSFTGSTRAGIAVAKSAADTVKRVAQELGGKSANIILDDADFNKSVAAGVMHCFTQFRSVMQRADPHVGACARHDEVVQIAKATAETVKVGDPTAGGYDHRAGCQRNAIRQNSGAD